MNRYTLITRLGEAHRNCVYGLSFEPLGPLRLIDHNIFQLHIEIACFERYVLSC